MTTVIAEQLRAAVADDSAVVLVYTGCGDGPLDLAASAGAGEPDLVDRDRLLALVAGRAADRPEVRTLGGRELTGLVRGDAHPCAVLLVATTSAGERCCVLALGGDGIAENATRHLEAVASGFRLREHLAGDEDRLRAEAGVVDTLHAVGRRLTAQLDIDRVVQDATDAGTAATGAAFGAFFYNLVDRYGESYTLYTLSGAPRAAFEGFPMPRNTDVFAPTFDGRGTVRSADITADPRFGGNEPYRGMPEGHLPVRSYLAVSAVSPTTGEVLGGFFFGHPEPGRFTRRHEYLAEGVAGYAAIALDNARLFERERNLATELSRSMQPVVPDIAGLEIVARYLPAATGIKVGGDWFDVIELASGRTAFVIGDVVGHGVTAAAVMGQVRTAIRSYALLELAPSELLRNVSRLTEHMPDSNFVTCFYAVHDPDDDSLTYANAGHLPAVLVHRDGTVERVGEALAQPLGVGREFPQRRCAFPRGSDLVLYTDGLVESRTRDLEVGIEALAAGLVAVRAAPDTGAACDALIEELTAGRHDDDVAVLHVRHTGGRP